MTEALVPMKVAAAARGCHVDTFRKAWRGWVRDEGFPAPVSTTRPYRWRPSSLDAWQARAEAAARAVLTATTDPVAPANENERHTLTAPAGRRIERERSGILALMSRAVAH